MVIAEIPYSL